MQSTRDKVFIAISQGDDVANITQKLNLGYSTVLKYKREYEDAKDEGSLDVILAQDAHVVREIAKELPFDASTVVDKIEGLDRLNVNLQASAQLILVKLKTVVAGISTEDSGDLLTCTRVLCDLQNAFFNKNSVNVNVQNNNFEGKEESAYGEFLSDKPPIDIPREV